MSGVDIHLQVQYRARSSESIEERHACFIDGMKKFGPPLGMQGLDTPPAPYIKPNSGDMIGVEWFRYPIKGLKLQMTSLFRHEGSLARDTALNDDRISIDFKTSNRALDYRRILREDFPKVIEAYQGYRAWVMLGQHGMKYTDCFWNEWKGREPTNQTYWRLREDPQIDIDGRNNIYTLEPAVFWDGELCQRALGYDRDEVIRRLQGHALLVRPLLDGVYAVFADDPTLSYESFVDMNLRFKDLLGLV